MEQPAGQRCRGLVAVTVSVLALLTLPTIARAAVITLSHQETQIEVGPGLIEVFDATAGGRLIWADPVAFGAGSGEGVTVSAEGLQLEPIGSDAVDGLTAPDPDGPPWWDPAWPVRVCSTIEHTDPVATTIAGVPIPVPVPIDTLIAADRLRTDFADLRAIGPDGATPLPLWVDQNDDTVWVRTTQLTAGTIETICLYTGSTEPGLVGANDLDAVFGSVPDPNPSIPEAWAVTDAVIPTLGLDQRLALTAVEGDVTVTISDAATGTVVATVPVTNGTLVDWTEPDSDPARSTALRVDSTGPVTIEVTLLNGDGEPTASFPIVPDPNDGPLYGVSPAAIVGTLGPLDSDPEAPTPTTTAERRRSADLTVAAITLAPGQTATASGGVDSGEGLAITADAALHGIATDGVDATSMLPRRELNPRYALPNDVGGLTVVCPEPDLEVIVDDPSRAPETPPDRLVCAGASAATESSTDDGAVGVVTDSTPRGAGTIVTSADGRTFLVVAEATDGSTDEATVALGAKQNRPLVWPEPAVSTVIEGRYPDTATWRSDARTATSESNTNVWGQLIITADAATAGNAVTARVATGRDAATASAAAPLGPDGSSGTSFLATDLAQVLAPVHNGDDAARVEVTLRSADGITTPTVTAVLIGHDLPPLARTPGVALTPQGPATDRAGVPVPLVRIRATTALPVGSTASIGADGRLLDATTGLDGVGPAPFGPGSMVTVFAATAGGPRSLDFVVSVAGDGPRSVTEIEFDS